MDTTSFFSKTECLRKKKNFPDEVIFNGGESKKELFIMRTRGRAFHAEKQLANDLRKVTSFSYKEQRKDQCD